MGRFRVSEFVFILDEKSAKSFAEWWDDMFRQINGVDESENEGGAIK